MFRTAINGFFMALCDSVPGVSGGTFAFIMGFYDDFIGCFHGIFKGTRDEKRHYRKFALFLLIGWIIGMAIAVVALTSLFESNIYVMSSLFVGFIAGSIPLVINEEKKSFRHWGRGIAFFFIGAIIVIGITYLNGHLNIGSMDMASFSFGSGLKMFIIGMVAICAMFLPGISGSTILIIAGVYIPVLMAVKGVFQNLAYMPNLICFIAGILVGIAVISKLIRICLDHFRPQMVYFILGMMIGSFYAIFMGPTTLEPARPAMDISTFNFIAAGIGVGIVLLMQVIKITSSRNKRYYN